MTKTLQECKEIVANDYGFNDWVGLRMFSLKFEQFTDLANKMYYEQLQSKNERLKAELLGNPEQLKAEMENVLNEVKDEIVEKFDSDPMVRRISNMVINEIKKRIITP